MPAPTIALIAAVARNGAIGRGNTLLMHLPGDLPRLKRLTMGCPIIMGRKTFDSIGRPLPGRQNIVVTRNPAWRSDGVLAALSVDAALDMVAGAAKVFVIGGAQIYAQVLPRIDEMHLTEIDAEPEGDAFFPVWNRSDFRETSREMQSDPRGLTYSFVTYHRLKGN
jgi:dihydrofolate reductase